MRLWKPWTGLKQAGFITTNTKNEQAGVSRLLNEHLRHHRRASFRPVSELSGVPAYGKQEVVCRPHEHSQKESGTDREGEISVVNLKCDTRLIGSFRMEPGIFPGWHMNKAHWLSVALDGTVDAEKIRFLVDMSYELTQ